MAIVVGSNQPLETTVANLNELANVKFVNSPHFFWGNPLLHAQRTVHNAHAHAHARFGFVVLVLVLVCSEGKRERD